MAESSPQLEKITRRDLLHWSDTIDGFLMGIDPYCATAFVGYVAQTGEIPTTPHLLGYGPGYRAAMRLANQYGFSPDEIVNVFPELLPNAVDRACGLGERCSLGYQATMHKFWHRKDILEFPQPTHGSKPF